MVCTGFGDDIDRRTGRRPKLGCIIAAIDLELLNGVLAHGETHAPAVAGGLTTVHSDAVSSAVAAIEGEPALRCLLDSEILVACQPGGIGDAWSEQREGQVVAAVYRKIGDVLL